MYSEGQFRDLLTEDPVSISEELIVRVPIDNEMFDIGELSPEHRERLADEMIDRWNKYKNHFSSLQSG